MNQILSDIEIDELYFAPDQQNARQFARSIERAVMQKLREHSEPVAIADGTRVLIKGDCIVVAN